MNVSRCRCVHGEEFEGMTAYTSDLRRSQPAPKPREQLRGPVQWRMDYVGRVAFVDVEGELLDAKKYRAPADADIALLVERVMADVKHALVQSPIEIAVVQDGAPELWTAITKALSTEPSVATWTEVLDWYHLDERLTKCLDICASAESRVDQRQRWHRALLEKPDGVRSVIGSLRPSRRTLEQTSSEELASHIGYLKRNRRRMAYREYRARSLPIGSGVTEGACKSVVNVRAKRSGQRWSQRGLSAVLHLRAMHESGRFDGFWSFFSRRYRAKTIVDIGASQ